MNTLYVNGEKCDDLFAVSYYNPTFLYGISCFEGVRAYWSSETKRLIFLDLFEHLVRLYASAKYLSFEPPLLLERLQEEILHIAKQEKIREDVYVRVTFFLGGDGSWHSGNDVRHMVSFRSLPSELGRRMPVTLGISRYRRISAQTMPPFVKAGANYLNSRYGVLDVRARGFDDALFLTTCGLVAEASGSTIFFFKQGELHTPSLECDILPGITRARLLRLCAEAGLPVHEGRIPEEHLATFDGAVLTGTMVEVRPVARLEAWSYETQSPLYQQLARILREYIYQAGHGTNCVAFEG